MVSTRSLNFARRPFSNERPYLIAAGLAVLLGTVLLFANVRQWSDFHRQIAGTTLQIESLEARRDRALRDASASRAALDSYRVSSLAAQSKGLLKLVAERRFSWTALLARLERTLPPEVRVTRIAPRFDESGNVLLDCGLTGKSHESVARTIVALAKDPVFEAIDLKVERAPDPGPGANALVPAYEFDLAVKYRAPASAAAGSPSP
jgi:Tfp pilus assembly protein PilN